MADIKDTPVGRANNKDRLFHDEGDGTVAEGVGAHIRGWDATDSAWNRVPVEHATGGLKVYVSGQAGGGSAVSVADGADVAQGTTTDAAVVSDTSGTVIGFLRGLVKLFAARTPVLGSTTSAGSSPVVVASDQVAVATKVADGVNVALGATTDAAASTTGSVIAQLRRVANLLAATLTVSGSVKLLDTGGTNIGAIDSSGALSGNLTKVGSTAIDTNSGSKSAGTQRVVLATDQPALTNALKVDPSAVTSPVSIATAPALVAGTAEIGRVGLSKTGTGFTPYALAALKATVTVNTAAGKFAGGMVMNLNSAPAYIQVFDVASGTAVTLGTTVPTFSIPIPCNSTAANGVGAVMPFEVAIAIANGIKVAATTTPTGSTQVTTGLEGFLLYA